MRLVPAPSKASAPHLTTSVRRTAEGSGIIYCAIITLLCTLPVFAQTGASGSPGAPVSRLSTVDTAPQQRLLTWRTELEAGAIDRDALLARIIEEQVPADTLVAILELLPLAHPMDPLYFPVCGALWDALEEDLDACLTLPYATRIFMAAYLGVLERPDDTKAW